jgi:hypothetical protein
MTNNDNGKTILMVASTMSVEKIIELLDGALNGYKTATDKAQAYKRLEVVCSLVMAKNIAPNPETAVLMTKKIDDLKRMDDLINPNGTSNSN